MSDDVYGFGGLGGAVRTGDQLRSLVALRDHLADSLDQQEDARATASLSKQLVDVMARIEDLGGSQRAEGATVLDQLAQKRRARKA